MRSWIISQGNALLAVLGGTVALGGFVGWMLVRDAPQTGSELLPESPTALAANTDTVVVPEIPAVSVGPTPGGLKSVDPDSPSAPRTMVATGPQPVTSRMAVRVQDAPSPDAVAPAGVVVSPSPAAPEPFVMPVPGVQTPATPKPTEVVATRDTAVSPDADTVDVTPERDAATDRATRQVTASLTMPSEQVMPEVDPRAPKFDLVRVEKDGAALVAGRAEPMTDVQVLLDGKVISVAQSNARGEFVAMVNAETESGAGELTLRTSSEGSKINVSASSVLILTATAQDAATPPAILSASPEKIELIQAARPTQPEHVTLDLITYDREGDVVLAGLARPNADLRIYANGRHVTDVSVTPDGSWRVAVSSIARGRYTLRVDELDESRSSVSSRIETPFQRDYPVAPAPTVAAIEVSPTVVVQPGNSLWRIAERHLGGGVRYAMIYSANRDRIRDPDLIYPGQIFDLPAEPAE